MQVPCFVSASPRLSRLPCHALAQPLYSGHRITCIPLLPEHPFMSLAATVAEKANLIWAIADKFTGVFKPIHLIAGRLELSPSKLVTTIYFPM